MRHTLFTTPEFLSPAECADWIRLTESKGFDDAPITTARGYVHDPDVRNNTRVMLDDRARRAVAVHVRRRVLRRAARGVRE